MMKKIFAIGLGVAGFIGAANVAGARAPVPQFLPNFEDVPVMPGLDVADQEGFLFSVPEGKIIEAFVSSTDISRRKMQGFYSDALQGLGWKEVRDESKLQEFSRDGDVLKIEILSTDPLEARFSLTPAEVPDEAVSADTSAADEAQPESAE